jgi:transposase
LKKGREGKNGKYVEFFNAIKEAEAVAENSYLEKIQKAAEGDPEKDIKPVWQAAAWYLERKHPDRWGRRERVVVNQSTDVRNVKVDIFAEIEKLEATLKGRKKLNPKEEEE